MTNKYGGRQPVDSLSGVSSSQRPRFSPRPPDLPPRAESPNSSQLISLKTSQPKKKKDSKTISFELKFPKIKLPFQARFPKAGRVLRVPTNRRVALGAGVLCLATLLGIASIKYFNNQSSTLGTTTEIKQTAPTFDTLAPVAEEEKNKPVNFDEEKYVASFADKIDGIEVAVSQQPLPDSFKTNPAQEVATLAKKMKANTIIDAGEIKAYSGFSSEDGYQTVIFTKNNLLIFIRSTQPLNNTTVAQYIVDIE